MKKLVLVAGLFIAFAANAQQGRDSFRNDKIEYRQNQRNFDGLRLTQRQEKEIFALSKQRLTAKEYDAKLKRILSREQYAQYQRGNYKGRNVAMTKPFRR